MKVFFFNFFLIFFLEKDFLDEKVDFLISFLKLNFFLKNLNLKSFFFLIFIFKNKKENKISLNGFKKMTENLEKNKSLNYFKLQSFFYFIFFLKKRKKS